MNNKIKVLIVDDQAVIRKILTRGLGESELIEVVGSAKDAFEARDLIVEKNPDVLTLDVEMPSMSGLEFLKKLMPQKPMPVIMVSSHTKEGQAITLEALDAGAIDFVTKPEGEEGGLEKTIQNLIEKIVLASKVDVGAFLRKKTSSKIKPLSFTLKDKQNSVIAIGASTGGTTAIKEILTVLPKEIPPIVIVQHMPPGFTKLFADRLNVQCALSVKEARDGEKLQNGEAYIAPGDRHVLVVEQEKSLFISLSDAQKVCGHKPSVEVLFESVSNLSICKNSIGVILTGMGKDGAKGLKKMSDKGAFTIGQDKSSCVVYGMPREAYQINAVSLQVTLGEIPQALLSAVENIQKNPVSRSYFGKEK